MRLGLSGCILLVRQRVAVRIGPEQRAVLWPCLRRGELSRARGATSKWAHKWAHQGDRVWHERWGEDYRGEGSDHW